MVKTSLNSMKFMLRPKSKGSRRDRLSNLPADVLCKILSNLSTKESISASILSKRWRNLWSHVPALELDITKFEDESKFFDFFYKFMASNKETSLERFNLVYDSNEHSHKKFKSLMDDVVKGGVRHLTVVNYVDDDEEMVRMPLSLYSCSMLVTLNLYCVSFDAPKSKVVCLPCVKTMFLKGVKFDGHKVFKTLISSCSVLEELIMTLTKYDDFLEVVYVRSQSLKRFTLKSKRDKESEEYYGVGDPYVKINAPRLEYMSIKLSGNVKIHNIGPNAIVNTDVIFDPTDISMSHNFLTGISTAREMIVSPQTLEMIHDYCESEPLPQFTNLSCLYASFGESTWEQFPTFLNCCPNLRSLVLDFDSLPEPEATYSIKLSSVPQCCRSSLEVVQLSTSYTVKGTSSAIKLPIYIMRNCAVLKELVLSESFGNVINKIKGIPKLSKKCKVFVMN